MHVSSGHPGARHDLEVFRSNSDEYKTFLQKEELEDDDAYWSMMADKGYIGADTIEGIVAVVPFTKMRGNLSRAQKEFNKKLGRARVISENFYGRLKTLWGIMRDKYQGDRARYPTIFLNCVALTNFHVSKNPLRNAEGKWYHDHLRALRQEAEQKKKKRQDQNRAAKRRRIQRIRGQTAIGTSSPSSSSSSRGSQD